MTFLIIVAAIAIYAIGYMVGYNQGYDHGDEAGKLDQHYYQQIVEQKRRFK